MYPRTIHALKAYVHKNLGLMDAKDPVAKLFEGFKKRHSKYLKKRKAQLRQEQDKEEGSKSEETKSDKESQDKKEEQNGVET